ncbi:dynamin family protein [Metabacillus sp. FJAT-52054]|uniref:Dynamin family protein n=1 Tax=Metabacillus sediminis TaxID=3117746 RepID=A0ABZ2NFV1_9BACI
MSWTQSFKEGLDHLISLCSEDETYLSINKQIKELRQDIDEKLTIMVAGEFNAGKSTFINAMLGAKVLSSDVTPETAMVTKLTYGQERKVIAHFQDGHSASFNSEWFEQLTAERIGEFEDIRKQLSYVEIQLPNTILNHITVIDTPGLNANNEFHTNATERFLERTDHAFFLFHAMYVGTATEKRWLEKFNEVGIKPFGIINRIDELDDEEDELGELISFHQPRLGPYIRKWFGVSAKDALEGKMTRNSQMLEWSNWQDIEHIIENIKEDVWRKQERAYSRLISPLRHLNQTSLERKISLPLKNLKSKNIVNIVTRKWPELLDLKHSLDEQRKVNQIEIDEWNQILRTPNYTANGFTKFLSDVKEKLDKNISQSGVLLNHTLISEWENLLLHKYFTFNETRKRYYTELENLNRERTVLEQDWKDICSSSFLRKKGKLAKHERKLEFYNHTREKLNEKHKELNQSFKEITKTIKEIQQSVIDSIGNDFSFSVETINKRVSIWNNEIEKTKTFIRFPKQDVNQIESFTNWMHTFNINVAQKLISNNSTNNQSLSFNEVSYLLHSIHQISDELPDEEFFSQWREIKMFSKELHSNPILNIPNLTPTELLSGELGVLPAPLNHNVEAELNSLITARNKWLFPSIGFMILALLIGSSYINRHESYPNDSDEGNVEETASLEEMDSYSDNSDTSLVTDAAESQYIEGEQTLESRLPRDQVERFIDSMYEQLGYDLLSHEHLFSKEGWEQYSYYYSQVSKETTFESVITNIEYVSETQIEVIVDESYQKSDVQRVYQANYTLMINSYTEDLTIDNLIVENFSYKLASKTVMEILVEDGEIESFLNDFRSSYLQALNEVNTDYVDDFFDQEGSASKDIYTYIESISGENFIFEELGFQVEHIEKVETNKYQVTTTESFALTDPIGEKTNNERKKEYFIKVLPEKRLFIEKITTKDATKEVVKVPTVQLVTIQQVYDFITIYYNSHEEAFNGYGFSNLENFYDNGTPAYESAKAYINNANSKGLKMNNLELSIESVIEADENHYIATVLLVDEYAYEDGAKEQKRIQANYKVRILNNGDLRISEEPIVKILEKTEY